MNPKHETKFLITEDSILAYVSFTLSEQFQLGLIVNEIFDREKVRKLSLKTDTFNIMIYTDFSATYTGEIIVQYKDDTVLLIPVQGSVAHVIEGVGDSHNECSYKFDYTHTQWL